MSRVRLAVIAIVLALVIYAGSYTALLDPSESPIANISPMTMRRHPAYRAGGDFAEAVFRPAAWVDRQLRPGYWADRVVVIEIHLTAQDEALILGRAP